MATMKPSGIVPPGKPPVLTTLRRKVAPAAALVSNQVSYHGGPLIKNVEIFSFYWGSKWSQDPGLGAMAAHMNQFLTDFASGGALDQLAEYSQPNFPIGRGLFRSPGWFIAPPFYNDPPASVDDAMIQSAVPTWIAALNLDQNENSLFMVFTPPGVEITSGSGKSCVNFCGYHGHIGGTTFYAAMPYPCPNGCTGGMGAFDALTFTASHEICEAVTDPTFTGWWDSTTTGNEIGDFCAWNGNVKTYSVGGRNYQIQKEWSNAHGQCI